MQSDDTQHQAQLGHGVDTLRHPVDPALGRILAGHIAHGHSADEGKNEESHKFALLHLGGENTEANAQTAETQNHHHDEGHAAGKNRGSNGQHSAFALPDEHADKAQTHKQQTQRVDGHEHFLKGDEIADVGCVQQLPRRFQETSAKNIVINEQIDLFTDVNKMLENEKQDNEQLEKEKNLQQAILNIKKKYGKNAVLKGMNFQDGATMMDRNGQIGGHKA